MPSFTCQTCGNRFSVPPSVVDKYPGWTPKQCMACKRGDPPGEMVEENLTTAEVLAKYAGGPTDGVFTDGSASPNPGPGGWGVVYVVGGEVVAQAHGAEEYTTNNKMELTALIRGYDLVPPGTPVTLYTDSKLVEQTINAWAKGWEARGWKRKGGEIKNLELVKEAYALRKARPEIRIEWIKAHNGARWNEYADSLSTAYSRTTV